MRSSELSLSRRMYTCTMCIIYRSKNIQTFARFLYNIISLRIRFIALHTRATIISFVRVCDCLYRERLRANDVPFENFVSETDTTWFFR